MKATLPRVLAVAVLALLMGVTVWAAVPPVHSVVIADTGHTVVVSGRRLRTVADALARSGIDIKPSDRVVPALATPLPRKGELTVTVQRAWPVRVEEGGSTQLRYTLAHTVDEALREWQIRLDPSDEVTPPVYAPLAPNATIHITRVRKVVSTVLQEIPYETVRREDESLDEGQVKELQPGVPGRKEVTLQSTIVDGHTKATDVLGEKVIDPPRPRILLYGTAGVVSRGGQNFRYTRVLDMRATGYTAGPESNPNGNGRTATGILARRGVVAVDPRVIPLGTRLYVEGYGPAVAADTGGAIKGNRIDLCFDSVAEADDFGVQSVRVYVLAD